MSNLGEKVFSLSNRTKSERKMLTKQFSLKILWFSSTSCNYFYILKLFRHQKTLTRKFFKRKIKSSRKRVLTFRKFFEDCWKFCGNFPLLFRFPLHTKWVHARLGLTISGDVEWKSMPEIVWKLFTKIDSQHVVHSPLFVYFSANCGRTWCSDALKGKSMSSRFSLSHSTFHKSIQTVLCSISLTFESRD